MVMGMAMVRAKKLNSLGALMDDRINNLDSLGDFMDDRINNLDSLGAHD